jgi:hypothetical protein
MDLRVLAESTAMSVEIGSGNRKIQKMMKYMQRQSPHGAWVSLLGDSARQDMHDSNAALHPPEVRMTRALSRVEMSGNMRFLTARTGMTATRTRGHRLRAIGCGPSVAGQTIVRRSAPSSFFLPDSSQGQSLRRWLGREGSEFETSDRPQSATARPYAWCSAMCGTLASNKGHVFLMSNTFAYTVCPTKWLTGSWCWGHT